MPYDEDTEREVERRLARALAIWRAEKVVRLRKARAAERLPFPHTAPRPVQEKIIEAVRAAVRSGENLLAEAPTGSGKTAAALHPALAEGLSSGRQVVFLTSKTLQQKMAVSSLVAMNERAFHTAAGPRQGSDVRQRPHPLPRGFLPLRQRLPGEDGALQPPRAPPRQLLALRPGHRLRRGAPRGSLPVRGAARAGRSAPTRSWPTTTTSSSRPPRSAT